MDSLLCLLIEGNYITTLDLKDAYFCIPLSKKSKTNVLFQRTGNFNEEFICLCFGLWPPSRNFYKINENPYFTSTVHNISSDNLFGRHVDNREDRKRKGGTKRHKSRWPIFLADMSAKNTFFLY